MAYVYSPKAHAVKFTSALHMNGYLFKYGNVQSNIQRQAQSDFHIKLMETMSNLRNHLHFHICDNGLQGVV